ncbi:MAG TPA: DNA mismatch repair endonuclease MutL, partial [Candidatus Binataceae bacterium]|nr:DNA mismatch repair endonuclease MutL [Candidatus Binataceae bacterium]
MERRIHILPEQVASQIAAGEVVERPASAIKELIENSLDAGAKSVSVEIERGGAGLIAVADDGGAMGREDAVLSIRRHATSKIREAADLGAIRTLGFRGEALASIASVSRMRILTRREGDPSGLELVAEGGEISATRECAIAPGTRIEVRGLFFNTPARLKFLKTVATEQSAVAEVVQRLAIAHPRVAFRLIAEGRPVYDLARAVSPAERARQLFGPKLAARMLWFEAERNGMRASGLAAMSEESFATPRMVFTFVNRRTVRDRMLARAIAQAYDTLIVRGRHPAAILYLELRPEEVDVNVHPMKTEVRFRNGGAVFELVYHALRARLADQTAADPGVVVAQRHEPIGAIIAASDYVAPLRLVPDKVVARIEQRALALGFNPERATVEAATALYPTDAPSASFAESQAPPPAPINGGGAPIANSNPPTPPSSRASGAPLYSKLRIVGQVFAGYIALEGDDGLILVDQHAAHERVTFERLKAEFAGGGIRVQALLHPTPIELDAARAPR